MSYGLKILIYAIMNLLSLYALYSGISTFLKRKVETNFFIRNIPFVVYFLFGSVTYLWNKSIYINIICFIILGLILAQAFEGTLNSKLYFAFISTTIRVILELLVGVICTNLFNVGLESAFSSDVLNIVIVASVEVTYLIIVKIINFCKLKIKISEELSFTNSLQILVIPICSIIILYSFIESAIIANYINTSTALSAILMVFINVFFFYLFDKIQCIEKIKYDNELLKNQSAYYVKLEENINNSYNKIIVVKHDLKNQLLYLKSKSKENTEEALEEINSKIDLLIGDCLSEEFKDYTKNPKLNRLLNYKCSSINKDKISIEIKSNISEHADIDESSLYIILGNAIDNAIENFNSEKSTEKKLKILVVNDKNNLIIKVTNPYNKNLIFKNDLPITDKSDKLIHGIGIKSIKKIVEDKNGHFMISTDNNIFSLEIILFDELN